MEWREQDTHGPTIPVQGKGTFSTINGKYLYVFGGLDDEDYRSDLFRLDLENFKWNKLPNINSPSSRAYGGMVAHGTSLVLFGGIGKPFFEKSREGADVITDDQFGDLNIVWNNSLHEYSTITGVLAMYYIYNIIIPSEQRTH